MHRTKIIFFCFFSIIMAAFAAMLLRLDYETLQTDSAKNDVYILTDTDYESILENNGTLTFRTEQAMQENAYRRQTLELVRTQLIPLAVAFAAFCFVLCAALWLVLRHGYVRNMHKIACQLHNITDASVITDELELNDAYVKIRQRFDDNLNDYKRLNSYLSHEQKNALAILRARLEQLGDKESLEMVDDITAGINDVLTLSENPEDSMSVSADVALICAQVCDNYRSISNKISFVFDEKDDTEITARYRWIYRAVTNLVDNAVKYGENKPVCISVKSKNGSVIVSVADQGVGISPEKQEKIFSQNYRIDELNQNGYGIGLSLVSHVCSLCGGFVTVESEPGKGSIFYMSFPQKNYQSEKK